MIDKLAEKIRNLFNDQEITELKIADFVHIPKDKWQYINDDKIRYKIVSKNKEDTNFISITEWLDDSVFGIHFHPDGKETIHVIIGMIYSVLDRVKKYAGDFISYEPETLHKIKGRKGTIIIVNFKITDNGKRKNNSSK